MLFFILCKTCFYPVFFLTEMIDSGITFCYISYKKNQAKGSDLTSMKKKEKNHVEKM